MKITHASGREIDTDTLSDVDAILMEKSKELHELFANYNRQLLLIGEMKASSERPAENGCVFFHVAQKETSQEKIAEAYGKYWWRANGCILGMTEGNLYIAKNVKPE